MHWLRTISSDISEPGDGAVHPFNLCIRRGTKNVSDCLGHEQNIIALCHGDAIRIIIEAYQHVCKRCTNQNAPERALGRTVFRTRTTNMIIAVVYDSVNTAVDPDPKLSAANLPQSRDLA